MNMLSRTVRYRYWQIGLLKAAMLSLGIAIGSYWPDVFLPYLEHLVALTVIVGIYLAFICFRER